MELSLLHIGVIVICIIDNVKSSPITEGNINNIEEIDAIVSSIRAKYQQLKMMKARNNKNSSSNKRSDLSKIVQELEIEQEIFQLGKVLKRKLENILNEDQIKYLKF